jgi:hypothetical protein
VTGRESEPNRNGGVATVTLGTLFGCPQKEKHQQIPDVLLRGDKEPVPPRAASTRYPSTIADRGIEASKLRKINVPHHAKVQFTGRKTAATFERRDGRT